MSCKLIDALKRTCSAVGLGCLIFTMISCTRTNYADCLVAWPIHYLHLFGSTHTFFHSLEGNKVGKSGASVLADSLRVNQSLKTLK